MLLNIVNTRVIASILFSVSLMIAAAPPEFEVATVRPTTDQLDNNSRLPSLDVEPGRRLHFAGITLKDVIMLAYGIGAAQIQGPEWLINRFDIVAQTPVSSSRDEVPLMLQSLLGKRFKLVFHREKKTISVFSLESGGGGPRLDESAPDEGGEPGCTRSRTQTPMPLFLAVCRRTTSAGLVQAMQTMAPNYFDRPVVDMTGLKGIYNFTLEWISYGEFIHGDAGPSIFNAVQKLGLKLEPKKQSMDIVVIDHCDKIPTDN